MKSNILFPLFFLSVSILYAQPGYNKLIEPIYDMNHFHDMIVVNDTIVGYGVGFDHPVNGRQGVILVKLDSFGNVLNSAIILDSLEDRLAVDKTWGKIIATSDGGFAMTAATVYRESAFLIKTDSDFNVEFIKEYPDTVNLSNFYYKLFEISDGYMLYGYIQRPNFLFRPFVRRVDKQGNTMWLRHYGSENISNTFVEGGIFKDSLFIFGGVKSGSTLYETSAQINVLDGAGEIIETWNSGPHPEMGFFRRLMVVENGNILIFGHYLIDLDNGIVQPTLSMMTPDFSFEWIQRYGRIDRGDKLVGFWDMESLPNGNFIGVGQSRIEVNGEKEQSGWLMKFNTEGDSIWSRYDFPDFPVDSLGDTFFGGVGVLSSGSIVAGGTATLWNEQAIWLVKVTNDGCMEVINCGLVPVVEREEEKEDLKIYPNPADNQITVLLNEKIKSTVVVEIYSPDGRLFLSKRIPNGRREISIETQGVPSGFYFVKVSSPNRTFHVSKVLISH